VVGHLRGTNCAQVDSVKLAQSTQAPLRHHQPMLQVVLASPVKPLPLQLATTYAISCIFHDPHASRNYLSTDSISSDNRDLVCTHSLLLNSMLARVLLPLIIVPT